MLSTAAGYIEYVGFSINGVVLVGAARTRAVAAGKVGGGWKAYAAALDMQDASGEAVSAMDDALAGLSLQRGGAVALCNTTLQA